MDTPCTTMEEYVQFETEKALRNNQVYNWETAKHGKTSWCLDTVDINILIFFETKFLAIAYNDALKLESDFSSKPTLNSQLVDNVNWENKTSLPEYDNEEYNFISERKSLKKRFSKKENFNILSIDEDLFSYEIPSDNDFQLDKGNDDNKIAIKQSLGEIFVETLHSIIDDDTYAHVSNELRKTSYDTISKIFTSETFIKELSINIMIWNYFNDGMLLNIVKSLYVPIGIPFDPKLFYKDDGYTSIIQFCELMLRRPRYVL
ncbi:hypothetical protein Tco_1068330 [Tanacetum coccineum]|uniref:Uncharacterized protein n=1 Tax=Tanacetum coccineum TaxID=301880 RepID=A0ABQ5HFE3_9ASTR